LCARQPLQPIQRLKCCCACQTWPVVERRRQQRYSPKLRACEAPSDGQSLGECPLYPKTAVMSHKYFASHHFALSQSLCFCAWSALGHLHLRLLRFPIYRLARSVYTSREMLEIGACSQLTLSKDIFECQLHWFDWSPPPAGKLEVLCRVGTRSGLGRPPLVAQLRPDDSEIMVRKVLPTCAVRRRYYPGFCAVRSTAHWHLPGRRRVRVTGSLSASASLSLPPVVASAVLCRY
jgi:hypothetical protein